MAIALIFAIAAAVVVLTILGYVPLLWALPAIGVIVAVLVGYAIRRSSGTGGA